MSEGSTPSPRRSAIPGWIAIALVAIAAVTLSVAASRTKSATFDEPVHLLSSWLIVNRGDYRINPEHPPLWKMIAGIPLIGAPVDFDPATDAARAVLEQIEQQGPLATDTLFRPGGNGPELLNRSRLILSAFLALTVLLAACWARSAGGWTAGFIAAFLIALDPNFLAHGALLTNDVAASLVFLLAGYLTWRLGRRWSWYTATALAATCAAGAGIKFTCILLVPMVGLPLLIRAAGRRDWATRARPITARTHRVGHVMGLAVITACLCYIAVWSFYLFRYAPAPAGEVFDTDYPRQYLAYNTIAREALDRQESLSDAQIKALVPSYTPSLSIQAIYWLQDRHLIPQSFGYGLTYAAGRGLLRPSFLLGDYSDTGFRFYFPVAIAAKTPLVTLGVLLTAAVLAVLRRKAWAADPERRWLVLCLLVGPAVYLASAMASNLNIGIRHILPIYPFAYVAAAVVFAPLVRKVLTARIALGVALALLAAETLSVHPNHLAFFNRAAGGERGGLRILSDSNLDWGQDLPALADWYRGWRAEHPEEAFYLAWFGSVDPALYGIDYINMSPGFVYDRRPPTLDLERDGVVAVSATWLAGTFPPELRPMMASLRARKPIGIINGSIYLYEFRKNGK